jgi:hypothetical protein
MARLAKLEAAHPPHGRAFKRSASNDGTAWFECDQGCCTALALF